MENEEIGRRLDRLEGEYMKVESLFPQVAVLASEVESLKSEVVKLEGALGGLRTAIISAAVAFAVGSASVVAALAALVR